MTASVTKADLDDNGKAVIDFGTIKYTEPGTYVYRVSEKNAGTTVDGIAYSKNVAEVTVTVNAQQEGRAQRRCEGDLERSRRDRVQERLHCEAC